MSITHSDCVFVASGIQYAMRRRHIVVCILAGSAKIFHINSQKAKFRKRVIEHKMCVLIFSTNLSQTFLILRRINRDMKRNVYWSSCKIPIMFLIILVVLRSTLEYKIRWKSVQWKPSCFMRTDRLDEANSLFSQFCERVSKWTKTKNLPEFNFSFKKCIKLY